MPETLLERHHRVCQEHFNDMMRWRPTSNPLEIIGQGVMMIGVGLAIFGAFFVVALQMVVEKITGKRG